MGYQPLEKLLPQANYSIYKLVCMASKRAMELADGQPKLIASPASMKTATLALEEIMACKVMLGSAAKILGYPKKAQKTAAPESISKVEQVEESVQG